MSQIWGVRIWGAPNLNNNNPVWEPTPEKLFHLPDIIVSSCYSGIDWVYDYVEATMAYDFRLWYFWLFNAIFADNVDLFFKIYWFASFNFSGVQLFWSIILDQYIWTLLTKLPFDEYWFRLLLASQETTLMLIYHPEIEVIKAGYRESVIHPYISEFLFPVYNLLDYETVVLPILLFPTYILTIYFISLFIMAYYSFFTSSNKEESTIDSDFLLASSAVESEEEISSFEDIFPSLIILIYIFGWFFYFQSGFIIFHFPEATIIISLIPLLYWLIVSIPTFLLYDFGIFGLAFLRGAAPLSFIVLELLYDYIAIFSFYIRLCVQGVRLLLMLFTFASLHDYILIYTINPKVWIGRDTFWDELKNINPTVESFTYYFFTKLPNRLTYWCYELVHTFFVVTAQIIAFFAMVFWLFFFLYSLFVYEAMENFFSERRKYRHKLLMDLYYYKKIN